MIVIEGPDLIGKTTLCESVRKEWNAIAESDPGPINQVVKFGLGQSDWGVKEYCKFTRRRMIADRMHMSEAVYGIVTRGGSNLSPEQYAMVDGAVVASGGMVVLLWADASAYAELMDAHHDRGEMFDAATCANVASAFEVIGRARAARGNSRNAEVYWLDYSKEREIKMRVDVEVEVTLRDSSIEYASSEVAAKIALQYLTLQKERG